MKLALLFLATLAVVWFWGDYIHSRIVAVKLRKWEATIERDEDGVRTGCREFTRGSGDTALLLIHGINDSPRLYENMATELARHGFTVRAMRLPGFAEPVERYAKTNRRDWIDGVTQEVDALKKEGKRVCIVAHSLGGAVTISYLLGHPNTVDRVVLLAPAVAVSNRRSVLLPVRFWHEAGRRLLVFTTMTSTPFGVDARDPQAREYPWMTPFVPLAIADETFQLLDENRGQAGKIRVPMLMILSKHDLVVDWQAAKSFYEETRASEKRLRFAEDAGHTIPIDHGWRDVADEISDFCKAPERVMQKGRPREDRDRP